MDEMEVVREMWFVKDPGGVRSSTARAAIASGSARACAAQFSEALGVGNLHWLGDFAHTQPESWNGTPALSFGSVVARVIPTDLVRPCRRILDAARFTQLHPDALEDEHLSLAHKGALIRGAAVIYEALVYRRLDGALQLSSVLRAFTSSHTGSSACASFRASGTCEHAWALRCLIQQAARLNLRFQARYQQCHGGFCADVVLIHTNGALSLMDVFLSGGCDCRSFLSSLDQILPAAASAELGKTFIDTRSALERVLPSLTQVPAAFPEERQMNVSLLQGLSTLAPGLDDDVSI